jgi:glycosyltransferase involved in cell wall biosynthesis
MTGASLRIAFVAPYFDISKNYEEVTTFHNACRAGHDCKVFTSRYISPNLVKNKKRLLHGAVQKEENIVRLQSVELPLTSHNILLKLQKEITAFRPDIIYFHNADSLNAIYNVWRSTAKVTVGDVHTSGSLRTNSFKQYIWNRILNFQIRFFDRLIIWGKASQDETLISNKIEYKNLPFRTDIFYYRQSKLSNKYINLCITGNYTRYKQIDRVIKLLNELDFPIRLRLIGNFPEDVVRLLKKIANFEINYLGSLSALELSDEYIKSHFALFLFHNSISIAEAMGCGCPVIVDKTSLQHYPSLDENLILDSENIGDNLRKIFLNNWFYSNEYRELISMRAHAAHVPLY